MSRWVVLLALLGACVIDPLQSNELLDPNTSGSGSDGGVILDSAVHEGGMDSGSTTDKDSGVTQRMDGGVTTKLDAGDGGSDGSDSGSGSNSGSGGNGGNGGDDAGLTDINNESDARTNFYACAGCGTSNPSQAGALAFGVILVIRRRRRR